MKTFVLVVLLLLAPLRAFAQTIEEGFEEWPTRTGSVGGPQGWAGVTFGVGKADSAYAGASALSVWNWFGEVIGFVYNGEDADPTDRFDRAGVPINFVPAKLTGYYRYELGDNRGRSDSAAVYVMLKRYDPERMRTDTSAFAVALLPPRDEWTHFSVDLPLKISGVQPDSIAIAFFSSNPERGARCAAATCCSLSVDELSLSSTSGVSYDLRSSLSSPRVLPNPVRSSARIEFEGEEGRTYRLRLFDAAGMEVRSVSFVGSRCDLSAVDLSAGVYYFSIADAEIRIRATGEFLVE